MSHLLEFPPTRTLPHDINSPPYVVFGIYGQDITSSLPPLIPLNLALHFAPALRKWTLPAPDLTYLPHSVACQCLRTLYIGIDIFASIDAVGLSWIIMRMLHLGGRKVGREMFSVYPDLATSLAIHNAWLALELPIEGLRGLHTHIHAQLMISSPPVSQWDMRMLWNTFPHTSEIVRAMGLNFIEAYVNMEYKVKESLEIMSWFQSTPELYAFFKSLQDAVPDVKEKRVETVTIPAAEENEKAVGTGYKTIGRKAGKAIKAAIAKEAAGQVGIMERGATWMVSPQERQEREANDFEAMRMRLRRTRSDDSLRSVDTAIWDPQTPEEEIEEEDMLVSDDMNDPSNYSKGLFSVALARTLESIRTRRDARTPKSKAMAQPPTEDLTSANPMRHSVENQPVFQIRAATTPLILHLLNDWEGTLSVHRRPGEANPCSEGETEHTGARS